jgi:hypothetical protein
MDFPQLPRDMLLGPAASSAISRSRRADAAGTLDIARSARQRVDSSLVRRCERSQAQVL